ncbi:MAG: TonB-dependent receptor [Cyclobacteriaceae bacterium]
MNKFWLFFIFCAGELSGQSVTVTVHDRQTGLFVPDVCIKVYNSNLTTVTDQQGRFKLSGLYTNSKILLTALGYENAEWIVTDSTSRIVLEKSSIYLKNNITITAKRFETNQFEISEGVTVVNSEDLLETSSRSAPEALMGTAGVWVQKTNHGSGSPIIRGLTGNQVLLMVDGIRMNNATYRYGPNQYLSTIDPGLIDKIEAIRGNGSVLYGSDALGGVVQILSRTPHFQTEGNQFHGLITGKWMSGAMEKSIRSEVQWNGEKIAALAGFSRRDFGDIDAGGSLGTLDPTGYDEFAMDGKVLIKTGGTGLLTAAWQRHQQNEVPRYDQVAQGGYSFYNFDPQIRELGYVRWETFTGNRIANNIRVTAGINRSLENIQSQKNGSAEIKSQEDIVNTFNGIVEVHSLMSETWQAQSGVEWYYDRVASQAKIYNPFSKETISVRGSYADGATSRSMSVFSTHTIDIKKISTSAGARFSAVSLSVSDATFGDRKIQPDAIVGSLGFAYAIHPRYRIFVSGNTGFRAPNVDDVSKFGAVESTVFEVPSESLSPERSGTLETGFKVKGKIFSGSLTAYRTTLSDLIERMPITYLGMDTIENRRVYQKRNISESILHGLEAEVAIMLSSHFSVNGNLTYTRGKNISKNEPMRRIPPLFGKLGLGYQHLCGFWFRMDYVYGREQSRLAGGDLSDARISVRLKNGVMPSWDILNLHGGFIYKFLSLTVSGQNLFDEAYRVYASGVDGTGRNMSITVVVKY